MSADTIPYWQIASVLFFILAIFSVYKLIVEQKDSTIQQLKERLEDKNSKIKELESQSQDSLTTALSSRIEISLKEIARLKSDGDEHKQEIALKEKDLYLLREKLTELSALIQDSDLLCKHCGAPLSYRIFQPIFGYSGGREIEAEVECSAYECGFSVNDGKVVSLCSGKADK